MMTPLIEQVAEIMRSNTPPDWAVRESVHVSFLTENIEAGLKILIVTPLRAAWTRTSRHGIRREDELGLVIVSKTGIDGIDFNFMNDLLNRWSELFLIDGGPLDDYSCQGVETLGQAEIGFSIEELIGTPSRYIGGLRLTFWTNT